MNIINLYYRFNSRAAPGGPVAGKILEQSLITKFKPRLNTLDNTAIKYQVWHDSYLYEYAPLSSRGKDYNKKKKYIIKYKNRKFNQDNTLDNDEIIPQIWENELFNMYSKFNNIKYFTIGPFTERQLYTRFKYIWGIRKYR